MQRTIMTQSKFAKTVAVQGNSDIDLPRRHHWIIDLIIQLFKTKPLGAVGVVIILGMTFMSVFAPFIAPYDPNEIIGMNINKPPGGQFLFGTDALARDYFSRVVYGARVSLQVGFLVVFFQVLIYTTVGTLSAYIGGIFDTLMQRVVDAVMCIPWMVFMLMVMAVLGSGKQNVIIALVLVGWAGPSRIIRGTVLAVKKSEYVLAARAVGCPKWSIVMHHILPNITAPIIVMATLGLGNIILAEAALSFLGMGIQPPDPSWGRMLSKEGMYYMTEAPWLAIFPGIAISLAVFGFNMTGDALRDLLDPKLNGTK